MEFVFNFPEGSGQVVTSVPETVDLVRDSRTRPHGSCDHIVRISEDYRQDGN